MTTSTIAPPEIKALSSKPADPQLMIHGFFIEIGNSDNKLSQREWAQFCNELTEFIDMLALTKGIEVQTFGVWYSSPESEYQNMAVHFQVTWELQSGSIAPTRMIYSWAQDAAERFRQDCIAVTSVPRHCTVMVGPRGRAS